MKVTFEGDARHINNIIKENSTRVLRYGLKVSVTEESKQLTIESEEAMVTENKADKTVLKKKTIRKPRS